MRFRIPSVLSIKLPVLLPIERPITLARVLPRMLPSTLPISLSIALPIALSIALSTLIAPPLRAHHSFASEFDASRPVLLRGKITRVEWINPHTWVHLEVEGEDGTSEAWMVEGGTPNTMLRAGFTRDSLEAGTEIVVRGYRSRDPSCVPACRANGRDITFPDGSKVFMASPGSGRPDDE